nr:uncharacterized protein LOC107397000 [Nothobranchius furzeri]
MCTGSVRLRFRLPASLRTSKMTRTSCLDSTANSVLRGTTAEGSRAGLLPGSERTGSACLGLNGGEPSQQRSGSCCHALSRTNPPIRCQPRHAGENVLVDSCVPGNLNLQVGSRGNYSCRRFSNQEGGFKRRTETPILPDDCTSSGSPRHLLTLTVFTSGSFNTSRPPPSFLLGFPSAASLRNLSPSAQRPSWLPFHSSFYLNPSKTRAVLAPQHRTSLLQFSVTVYNEDIFTLLLWTCVMILHVLG